MWLTIRRLRAHLPVIAAASAAGLAVLLVALPGDTATATPATSSSATTSSFATTPAPPADEDRKAQVELLLTSDVVRPGETIQVGIKFTMQPGWHIYWIHPGDAGAPPTFSWNLPAGGAARALRGGPWSATEPKFPTPTRFVEPGDLVGYGYDGQVIFPATITVPASATPGQEAELILVADYLICEAVCLPESAMVTAVVRVGVEGVEEEDSQVKRSLREAQARLPQPVEQSPYVRQVQIQSSRSADGVQYEVAVEFGRHLQGVEFFPAPPEELAVEEIEVELEGTRATVRFRMRAMGGREVAPRTVPAVIGFDTAGGRRGVEIDIPWRP